MIKFWSNSLFRYTHLSQMGMVFVAIVCYPLRCMPMMTVFDFQPNRARQRQDQQRRLETLAQRAEEDAAGAHQHSGTVAEPTRKTAHQLLLEGVMEDANRQGFFEKALMSKGSDFVCMVRRVVILLVVFGMCSVCYWVRSLARVVEFNGALIIFPFLGLFPALCGWFFLNTREGIAGLLRDVHGGVCWRDLRFLVRCWREGTTPIRALREVELRRRRHVKEAAARAAANPARPYAPTGRTGIEALMPPPPTTPFPNEGPGAISKYVLRTTRTKVVPPTTHTTEATNGETDHSEAHNERGETTRAHDDRDEAESRQPLLSTTVGVSDISSAATAVETHLNGILTTRTTTK
jgi:hypothetical protein